MKQVALVMDNYKVEKFKNELKANGFMDFDVFPFQARDTTTIMVNVEPGKMKDIERLGKRVELWFKRSN